MQLPAANDDGLAVFERAKHACNMGVCDEFTARKLLMDAKAAVNKVPTSSNALSAVVLAEICVLRNTAHRNPAAVLTAVQRGLNQAGDQTTFVANACMALKEVGCARQALEMAERLTTIARGDYTTLTSALDTFMFFGHFQKMQSLREHLLSAGHDVKDCFDPSGLLAVMAAMEIDESAVHELAEVIFTTVARHMPIRRVAFVVDIDNDDPDVGQYVQMRYEIDTDIETILTIDDQIFEACCSLKKLDQLVGKFGMVVAPRRPEGVARIAA